VFPVDALWLWQSGVAGDDFIRRDDEVEWNIVGFQLDFLLNDLNRMDAGDYRSPAHYLSRLYGEPVLQIGIAAALSNSGAVPPDRHRSAQDQIHPLHLLHGNQAPIFERAFDAGPFVEFVAQAAGIQLDEAFLLSQAGHSHVDDLSLLQRQIPQSALRRI